MRFRSSPPLSENETSISLPESRHHVGPSVLPNVAGHRSAGGTSLKENYPTLAWSLHRKNASQSGQDPCLLSRKRKKGHTPGIEDLKLYTILGALAII